MQNIRIQLNYSNNPNFDVDITAFMLANDKYIPNEQFMVYYHNLQSGDGAVTYTQSSENTLQNRCLTIDLTKISPEIEEIYFIVSLYDAAKKGQNFSKIPHIQIDIHDLVANKKLNTYPLNTNFPNETAIELGRLFVRYGRWRWETLSVGYQDSLEKFVNKYVY